MSPDRPEHEESVDRSFADILNEFETTSRPTGKKTPSRGGRGKGRNRAPGPPAQRGTVVGISGDFVLIDYGAKSEGVIPAADLRDPDGTLSVKHGDTFDIAITGFNSEGMATLSRVSGHRP